MKLKIAFIFTSILAIVYCTILMTRGRLARPLSSAEALACVRNSRHLEMRDYSLVNEAEIRDVTTPVIWSQLSLQVFDCHRTSGWFPDFIVDRSGCIVLSGNIINATRSVLVVDFGGDGVPEMIYIGYSGSGVGQAKVGIVSRSATGMLVSNDIYHLGCSNELMLIPNENGNIEIAMDAGGVMAIVANVQFNVKSHVIEVYHMPDISIDVKRHIRYWSVAPHLETYYRYDENGDAISE